MSPTLPFSYPVEIKHLYISPGHNYFTNVPGQPGSHPTTDEDQVEAVAAMGLKGDRFYGYKDHYEGQVTFFAWEVYEEMCKALDIRDKLPEVFRRNIVISGIPVTALIGHEFSIGDAVFRGTKHCAPCSWMDAGFGDGALRFLRGRGGLRARILETGTVRKGPATLYSAVELDPARSAEPLPAPDLP